MKCNISGVELCWSCYSNKAMHTLISVICPLTKTDHPVMWTGKNRVYCGFFVCFIPGYCYHVLILWDILSK